MVLFPSLSHDSVKTSEHCSTRRGNIVVSNIKGVQNKCWEDYR